MQAQAQAQVKALAQDRIKSNALTLLIIFILLILTYPFSEISTFTAVFYLIVYCALLGFGTYIMSVNQIRTAALTVLTLLTILSGTLWIFEGMQTSMLAVTTFVALLIFLATLNAALIQYMFQAERVTDDILFTATTIFILLGNIFNVLFMLIEILTQLATGTPAFIISAAPEIGVTWQDMLYYSFATLTTLGYGDILPVSRLAQAFASLEAIVGVLYIAIIVSRLVALYSRIDTVEKS